MILAPAMSHPAAARAPLFRFKILRVLLGPPVRPADKNPFRLRKGFCSQSDLRGLNLLLWLLRLLRSCALAATPPCTRVLVTVLLHLLPLLALFRREDRFNLLHGVLVNATHFRHAVLLRQRSIVANILHLLLRVLQDRL